MNAWVREPHPGAHMSAGYFTLVNPGSEAVTLTSVRSDAFESVEMHEMAKVDGRMRMRPLANLVIPAGGRAQLEPGGMHLMLMNPLGTLSTGQQVDLTLTFESGIRQTITLDVANR